MKLSKPVKPKPRIRVSNISVSSYADCSSSVTRTNPSFKYPRLSLSSVASPQSIKHEFSKPNTPTLT